MLQSFKKAKPSQSNMRSFAFVNRFVIVLIDVCVSRVAANDAELQNGPTLLKAV